MRVVRRIGFIIGLFSFITFFIGGCVTQSRFQNQVDENQSLSIRFQEEQDQRTRLEKEVAALSLRTKELRSKLVDEMDTNGKRVKDLEGQIEKLETDLKFSIKIGGKTERELKNELIRLRGSYEGSLHKARQRVLEMETLQFESEEQQSRVVLENKTTIAELNRKYLLLEDRILEQDREISEIVDALKFSQEKTTNLNQELAEKEEAHQALLGKLRNRIAVLDQERVGLTTKLQLSEKKSARKDRELQEASQAHQDLVDNLKKEISDGSIKITRLKNSLSVEIVDKILFSSGSTQITPEGKQVLKKVSEVLSQIKENDIRIEGHTDNVPIGPGLIDRFASNWELSTARATRVVRFLSRQSVPPENMLAAGFSQYRPLTSNETEKGKQRNRRIEIVLFPRDIASILEDTE